MLTVFSAWFTCGAVTPMAAMRTGAGGTDDYLAEWRKADPVPVGDDIEAEVEKAYQELDAKYDRERLVALVKAGGKENV